MKTPLIRFLVASLALSVVGVSAGTLHAAESTATLTTSTGTPGVPARFGGPMLDLDFPGGTLAQLVAAISISAHSPYNLIGEKAQQEIQLPPIALHNFEPGSLTLALSSFLRAQGVMITLSSGNIFVLTKAMTFSPGPQVPTFQAFQLAAYLTTMSIDDVTDAIKTAWDADPVHDAKPLTFKYHAATKLLFVYGPPEAIAIASAVIPQLNPVASARLRNESYAGLRPGVDEIGRSVPPILHSSDEERARLDRISEEVRLRRSARESTKTEPAQPALEKP